MYSGIRQFVTPALVLVFIIVSLGTAVAQTKPQRQDVRPDAVARSAPPSTSSSARVQPVVTMTAGHSGSVYSVAFSSDGRWLVTSGSDASIKVWEIGSGKLLRTMNQGETIVSGVAVSPNNREIVSSSDKALKFWNPATGQLLRTIANDRDHGVAYSADGRSIIAPGSVVVRRFDAETAKLLQTFKAPASDFQPLSAAMSRDGRLVAAGQTAIINCSCEIVIWDAASARVVRTIKASPKAVRSLAFSPDGRWLAAGNGDKTVKLWDVATGQLLRTLEGHSREVGSVIFSPDGRLLVSGSWDESVKIWDAASGALLRTIEKIGAKAVTFSPDGRTIAAAGYKVANIIDPETGSVLKAFQSPLDLYSVNLTSISFVSKGQWLVSSLAGLNTWDGTNGQLVQSVAVRSSRWSLAGGSADSPVGVYSLGKSINLWNFPAAKVVASFDAANDEKVYPVSHAMSPDGRWIASANLQDSNVKLWDSSSGEVVRTLPAVTAKPGTFYVHAIAFSPDGNTIATAAGPEKGIRLWDRATGQQRRTIGDDDTRLLRFSSDGRWILADVSGVLSGESVKLWDVQSGQLVRAFKHGFTASGFAISNDGRYVAVSGGYNAGTHLFETSSGRLIKSLEENSGSSHAIAFSADTSRIAVANENGTVTIWNTETGALLTTSVYSQSGEWVTITPEGFFVASEQGAELLHVVRGFDAVGIDQFYQSLYRPDLVREKLAGDPRGMVREAAVRLDLTRVIASGSAPDVRLRLPARGLGAADGAVAVEAEIIDRGGGVGRVEWRVNGVTAGIDNPAPASAGQSVRLTRSLSLDAGDNIIEVVAYNGANLIASVPGRVTVAAQALAPVPAPGSTTTPLLAPAQVAAARLFVLAAGSDDYADKRFRLQYSVPDAKAMAQAFADSGKGLYQNVEVKVMSDAEVVSAKLDAAFSELAAKIQPTDVFVVYLAGHGKTVDGRYYFVPQNFKLDGETVDAAVKAQGISQEQWQRWFALIPARKSVILFDTCESGTLTGDAGETKALERGAANDRLAQATGRSIITASSGSTDAFEGYHGHGLFTYNLLDALDKGDGDNSGTIEVTELAAYVYAQVTAISERVFERRQEPQMKIALNYPLTRRAHVLPDDAAPVAAVKPTYQVQQIAQLQIKPASGATVVRSLSAKTAVTVLRSEGGWSLIASEGRPLGYVATRELAPIQ